MQKRSSITAFLILAVGLVIIFVIIVFSSITIFVPTTSVIDVDQAKALADQYASSQYLDLRVKEIMEFSNHYYVIIQEENSGINAFELLVDKATGRVFLEPGPTMMWNTKYGHMRYSNPTAIMPVSSEQALRNAQGWLDAYFPGASVEEAETFYGYYTIDFSRNNQIIGMLSVNGYSGEVWYHTWHGQFIRMVEYD
ncbi:MAG: hypothetical protein QW146_04945 [Candidatus Bathyarchaeia archaeon]